MPLLLNLALVGAISSPEMEPATEVPPAETSPTSVEAPTEPSDSPTQDEAAIAPETRPEETRPVETPVAETPVAETRPVETPSVEPRVETPPVEPPPVEPPPPTFSGPPGGYWSIAEAHERSREPLDGDDELTIGSVLFSLGFLRAGAGVVTALMADNPDLCPLSEPRGCSGLRNYGWAGVAEGGLMIATGITYLAIGATRRQRHRRWEQGDTMALWRPVGRPGAALNVVDVGPWLIPRSPSGIPEVRVAGAGLRLQLRF